MSPRTSRPGITLIEIAIGIGIMAMLIALVAPSYATLRVGVALGNASRELQSSLRLVQNRAFVSQGGTTHGVHLEAGYYVLFGGSWEVPTYTKRVDLPHGVSLTTGAGQTVIFSRLGGLPDSSSDLALSAGSNQRVVRVDSGGLISLP